MARRSQPRIHFNQICRFASLLDHEIQAEETRHPQPGCYLLCGKTHLIAVNDANHAGRASDAFRSDDLDGDEGEESEVDDVPDSYPVRTSISITKDAGVGALTFDAMVQDGLFVIENISFYADGKLGTEMTSEADWKRRGLYIGPQFETLDVGVQEEFTCYLQERGINEDLGLFIPELVEYREQKEYVKWLGRVKGFVDA